MRSWTEQVLARLNDGLYEREAVVRMTLLATVAGESIFMLGPPGVAKSMIARRIKQLFSVGTSFEYLMNRFSTPDELFGPIAISKLKAEDKYERVIDGYLPAADVVFLDEIWKAGPSIQNALLTVINEKLFRNGSEDLRVPMKVLVAASNELPAQGQGLGALWDRFIIRLYVDGIKSPAAFDAYLTAPAHPETFTLPEELQISDAQYAEWQNQIATQTLSPEALHTIKVLREFIRKYNEQAKSADKIYVSDRRWRKVVRLLKASAFLNGRTEVDLTDCYLLVDMIWEAPVQLTTLKEFLSKAIARGVQVQMNYNALSKEVKVLKNTVDSTLVEQVDEHYEEATIFGDPDTGEYVKIIEDDMPQYLALPVFKALKGNRYTSTKLRRNIVKSWHDYSEAYEIIRHTEGSIKVRKPSTYSYALKATGKIYKLVTVKRQRTVKRKRKPTQREHGVWNERISHLKGRVETALEAARTRVSTGADTSSNLLLSTHLLKQHQHHYHAAEKDLIRLLGDLLATQAACDATN